jgi:hypothetical protein
MIDMRENKSLKKHHLNLTFWYKTTDNLLLSPQKIDLTAGYLTFFADYMLLSTKKIDLTAENRKKMSFFAASNKKQRHADWTQRRKKRTP